MKKRWLVYALEVIAAIIILILLWIPTDSASVKQSQIAHEQQLNEFVRGFLEEKKSPLASETDFLLEQKHWKLLIAISAIESQYCKRQLGLNCWGITKFTGGYKEYSSLKEGIKDANDLIERWQARGRWLTVEDMNCHWVVPCNDNWVKVVNQVIIKLERNQKPLRM